MEYMYELKDKLCKELDEIARKGELGAGDLEIIHKLTDTIKNIDKIDMLEDESGYSEDGAYMGEGRIYGTSYDDGMRRGAGYSYARGRGRYAKRDSMGRYSRDVRGMRDGYSRDDAKSYMIEQIEEMMETAEKPTEKEALRRCMDAIKRA